MKKNVLSFFVTALSSLMLVTGCGGANKENEKEKDPVAKCENICPDCKKCNDTFCTEDEDKCTCYTTSDNKHLITDKEGNYGGGTGAPKNGLYDVLDSEYYPVHNDYYNIKSTNTRTVLPRFQGYQQTQQYSDGIACLLMVMNYFKMDVRDTWDEETLIAKFEEITGKDIENDLSVGPADLAKLAKAVGLEASPNDFLPESTSSGKKAVEFTDFVTETLKNNSILLVKYQDGADYRWHVVLGVDYLSKNETASVRDNVMIMADPCDDSDHMQDGYSISEVSRFIAWWYKQGKSSTTNPMECLVIEAPEGIKFNLAKTENDTFKTNQTVPERNLLLNSDGSFGGALDQALYGSLGETNGIATNGESIEHTDYSYFAYPDYYNMESTDNRTILTGFKAFEQTEASACGICSVTEVMNYYGLDWSQVHTNEHILNRQKLFDKGIKPNGTINYWNSQRTATFQPVTDDQNERKQEASTLIYMDQDTHFASGTELFNNYGGVGASKLANVPKALGFRADYKNSSSYHGVFPTYEKFTEFVRNNLALNQPICTGWCPVSGHWTTIIGYDDMGTTFDYDDVIIIADSHDVSDHYQDGYNTYPAKLFWGQWRNGGGTVFEQYVVVKLPLI